MQCDQPQHEIVQACQTLAMYWFAIGQTDRTNMHYRKYQRREIIQTASIDLHVPDIAYRTCHILGYNSPIETASADVFSAELRRRAFWSSWSMGCLIQNNAPFKAESWREAIGLPLPCDEASFAARRPILKEAFDAEGDFELLTENQLELSRTSYMGEIVKLLSVWYRSTLSSNDSVTLKADKVGNMSFHQEIR
jgi:hypothetical protein